MRIWHPIPPFCLDRQRLLGEHRELHAIWSILTNGKSGYRNHPEVKRWERNLSELALRHHHLVIEMERRGYCHKSPLDWGDDSGVLALHHLLYDLKCAGALFPKWPDTWEPIEVMRQKLADKQGHP